MKTLTVSLISFFILLMSCTSNTRGKKYGSLYVDNVYYDIGKVNKTKQDTVNFQFDIYNHSDKNVEIVKLEPSCECVVIDRVSQCDIPQHEMISVFGYVKVKEIEGKVSKTIFVTTNENTILLLKVIGIVES